MAPLHHRIESESVMKNKYCFQLMNEHPIFNFPSCRWRNVIIIINKRKTTNEWIGNDFHEVVDIGTWNTSTEISFHKRHHHRYHHHHHKIIKY